MDEMMNKMKESILNPTEEEIKRLNKRKEIDNNGGCYVLYISNIRIDENKKEIMTLSICQCYGLNEEKVRLYVPEGEDEEIDHFQIRKVVGKNKNHEDYEKYDDLKCHEKFGIEYIIPVEIGIVDGQCFNN